MNAGDRIITRHMVDTLSTFTRFVGDFECSLPNDTKKAAGEHFAQAMYALCAALVQDGSLPNITPEQAAALVSPASTGPILHTPD